MEILDTQATLGHTQNEKVQKISALLQGKDPAPVEKKEETPKVKPQAVDIPDPELAFDTDSEGEIPNSNTEVIQSADPESDEQPGEVTEAEVKPATLNDLASTLDVETKDLYSVEIPIGSDESMTLGQLKDSHKELSKLQAQRSEYDDNRERSENELMTSKRQISQLIELSRNAGVLTPEIITQIDNTHAANLSRERSALMSAIPEWKDNATRDNDFGNIVSILGEYGISKKEIESNIDHRIVKFAHDMTKRLMAVRSAKEAAKVPASLKGNGRKQKKASALEQKIAQAKQTGNKHDKLSAVSQLLNNIK